MKTNRPSEEATPSKAFNKPLNVRCTKPSYAFGSKVLYDFIDCFIILFLVIKLY